MRCFGVLVVFACAFGVITAAVDVEDAQSQPKEAEKIEIDSDIRNGGEDQTDFKSSDSAKEFQVNSIELSVESDDNTNDEVVDRNTSSDETDTDTSESTNQVTKDSIDEVDTNISSKEIDPSSNEDKKSKEIDTYPSNEDDKSKAIDTSSNEDDKSKVIDTSSNEDEKSKENDASNSKEDENNNSSVDTNSSSEEIGTKTGDDVDTNSTSSSQEIDEKTDHIPIDVGTNDPSEQLTITTDSPTVVTAEIVFPNQKVIGLNIGLYFVLEELRRRSAFPFPGRVPTELIVKVLMLSSKIEKEGGEVIPLNKNMMKIITDHLPNSFKDAVCSPP